MQSRMQPLSVVKLEDAYTDALPASRQLFERAQKIFPDGVTHDNRRMQPFPIFIERAEGAYKWDADGHRYIDYWMGHGALLLGHSPSHIREAVVEQMGRGTHYGASHRQEVEWGEWVCRLVPCAAQVRFTASGTEATHMALRLARAFTGKTRVVKFAGHFHGWHEGLEVGVQPPYEEGPEAGQMAAAVHAVALCPPNDVAAVRAALAAGDVACDPRAYRWTLWRGADGGRVPGISARRNDQGRRPVDLRRGGNGFSRGAGWGASLVWCNP